MQEKKQVNVWKWAFFGLLALMVVLITYVVIMVYTPSNDQKETVQTTQLDSKAKSADIDVSVNKKQLQAAINYYLRRSQKKDSIKYRFVLDKSAILMGTTKVLGKNISFTLYSKPSLNKRGDIVLNVKSVGIGSLVAPAKFVMTYVKNNYDLGKMAKINPKEETITLDVNQLTKKQGIKVVGKELNIDNNKFLFKVKVPLK